MAVQSEHQQALALHTTVRIGLERTIRGQITAICIRATGITYEVVWWSESQRHCEWLSAVEVAPEEGQETMELGHYLERVAEFNRRSFCPRPFSSFVFFPLFRFRFRPISRLPTWSIPPNPA